VETHSDLVSRLEVSELEEVVIAVVSGGGDLEQEGVSCER